MTESIVGECHCKFSARVVGSGEHVGDGLHALLSRMPCLYYGSCLVGFAKCYGATVEQYKRNGFAGEQKFLHACLVYVVVLEHEYQVGSRR